MTGSSKLKKKVQCSHSHREFLIWSILALVSTSLPRRRNKSTRLHCETMMFWLCFTMPIFTWGYTAICTLKQVSQSWSFPCWIQPNNVVITSKKTTASKKSVSSHFKLRSLWTIFSQCSHHGEATNVVSTWSFQNKPVSLQQKPKTTLKVMVKSQ